MKQVINEGQVFKKLNSVEKNMFKSLQNDPKDNVERKWKRGHGYYLVGKKITNSHGEARFSFETIRIPERIEPLDLTLDLEKKSRTAITEKILLQKIEELNRAISTMKARKSAWQMLLEEYFKR